MIRVLTGDCRDVLTTLPANSVQMVCTSPPYYGLRDYGTATWEGGDPECDHRPPDDAGNSRKQTAGRREHVGRFAGPSCHKCGARRIDSQIGLEPTLDEYVANLVAVFDEVRRVMRDDGTLWLVLGDSYASQGGVGQPRHWDGRERNLETQTLRRGPCGGIKPKDLMMVPARVAIALQADGWWVRQDNVWAKTNPIPESAKDRTTRSHEYVFMLSKAPDYFYDAGAIAEPSVTNDPRRPYTSQGAKDLDRRAIWHSGERRNGTDFSTRNRRSVWTIDVQPYPGAHFATMPEELATICILAGSRPGDMVLDPFGGVGTTGAVAARLGRDATLIDLNPSYCRAAERRCAAETPPLPFWEAAQ